MYLPESKKLKFLGAFDAMNLWLGCFWSNAFQWIFLMVISISGITTLKNLSWHHWKSFIKLNQFRQLVVCHWARIYYVLICNKDWAETREGKACRIRILKSSFVFFVVFLYFWFQASRIKFKTLITNNLKQCAPAHVCVKFQWNRHKVIAKLISNRIT